VKVYISVDMEGISGIVDWKQVTDGEKQYERGQRLMTADASAAVEGALAGGATEVLVNDAHGSKRNLLIEELHPVAELISGRVKPLAQMAGVDEGNDLAFLVGYHAQTGSMTATLNHTTYLIVHDVSLNDRPVGELGLNAALAGHFGVPVVLVTGDQALVDEARDLLGDVETVVVKQAYEMNAARCLPLEKSRGLIKEAAARAVQKGGDPFTVSTPVTVRVGFQLSMQAQMASLLPGSRRLDARTVEYRGPDMLAVFKAYRAITRLASTAK
jgi:D-amino peptidase